MTSILRKKPGERYYSRLTQFFLKYLGINLTNEVKDLYNDNVKDSQERNPRRLWKMGRLPMLMDQKSQYCKTGYFSKGPLQIQCNPIKIIKIKEIENESKFYLKTQTIFASQSKPKQKQQCWRRF